MIYNDIKFIKLLEENTDYLKLGNAFLDVTLKSLTIEYKSEIFNCYNEKIFLWQKMVGMR